MARRTKSRDRVDQPTVTVKCTCGQRAMLAYTYEMDGITYGGDGYRMGGTWDEATPFAGGMGTVIKNIADEDWWRFVCGRCGKDWRGREVQIAGLVRRAQSLNSVTASLEHLPSPQDAYRMGARHSTDRMNRWRGGDPTAHKAPDWVF